MEKQTVFIKVKVKDRLPSENGVYITNLGIRRFDPETGKFDQSAEQVGWETLPKAFRITYWLEEIELPSEEEIEQEEYHNFIQSDRDYSFKEGFKTGTNFILNKLKGENK